MYKQYCYNLLQIMYIATLQTELKLKKIYIYIYIQGPQKKCIHNLTKEKSMLYVSTKFNYTSQVEYKLQYSTIQVTIEHNTSYNTAQYKLQYSTIQVTIEHNTSFLYLYS